MRNIAIIPARSGSKGLKDKNIKELNGKPLMAYTIEAALESGIFDCVHVSTDSEKYAENPSGGNFRRTSCHDETAEWRTGTLSGRQDYRWKCAVFLCADCHGMSLRMFYRVWGSDQSAGQSYSSGSQKMRYSYP